jgi:hypothetical protein
MPKLTKKEKEQIREWLKNPDKGKTCPFVLLRMNNENYIKYCERICENSFPRTRIFSFDICPCHHYSLRYVIQKAKEMIK